MLTIKLLGLFALTAKITVVTALVCGTNVAMIPGVIAFFAAKEAVAVNG